MVKGIKSLSENKSHRGFRLVYSPCSNYIEVPIQVCDTQAYACADIVCLYFNTTCVLYMVKGGKTIQRKVRHEQLS